MFIMEEGDQRAISGGVSNHVRGREEKAPVSMAGGELFSWGGRVWNTVRKLTEEPPKITLARHHGG